VRELRSLQKAGILRKHFAAHGVSTPTLAVYTRDASEAPRIDGEQITNVVLRGKRDFVKAFAAPVAKQFADANLVVMHGHGIPGMSCSVDIAAIPDNCQGKFVLTGSCFSASPRKSDWPALRQAPGGYSVEQRDAFVVRAVDRGALVGFGHMRLSSGFPHLFPVLETWLHGGTVGAAYQELLNGLIETTGTRAGGFVVNEKARPAQNVLLYVVIGDPALQPFQRLTK
jgi:hypothetical protein